MNLLKKMVISGAMTGIIWLTNITNVSASSASASLKGFNVGSKMQYCCDYYDTEELKGSKLKYGDISMWCSLYNYYDNSMKQKYYVLLVEAKNSSNIESINNGYYRMVNKEMLIEASVYHQSAKKSKPTTLIKYTPEEYGDPKITQTYNTSMSFTVAGGSLSTGYGVSYTETIRSGIVKLVPYSPTQSKVTMDYIFEKTNKKSVNNTSPLRGDCIQRMAFVFRMDNTSIWGENDLELKVSFTGKIQKMACTVFGCSGCETETETIDFYVRPEIADSFAGFSYIDLHSGK